MIDNFAIALTHGLMILAAWRLLSRHDLDTERPRHTSRTFGRDPAQPESPPPDA